MFPGCFNGARFVSYTLYLLGWAFWVGFGSVYSTHTEKDQRIRSSKLNLLLPSYSESILS